MARRKVYQHTPETKEKVLAAVNEGVLSIRQIADKFGVHVSSIYVWKNGDKRVQTKKEKKEPTLGVVKHAIVFLKRASAYMESPPRKSELYALLALDALLGDL